MAPKVAVTAAIAPQAMMSARLKFRRDTFPADEAAVRIRSAIDACGAYAPPTASIAIFWSGGASLGSLTARIISSACTTSGLLRTVVASPAESDGLTLLVESSACHFGSGGAGGAATFAAGARATTSPPAAAGDVSGCPAQGAGPSTSLVSYLITSTGHPSAPTMIDGVRGFRNSAFIAGGRMMQVSSRTSNTSGQSFSHASQTMQPGAIQTLLMI